ncbi:acetyl-CoA acetyltransferase [Nocardia blacklockiae]|uniref:thiolase family protein n=1 Tax=Nocardia blacklockiae TaxID=480036 RepID=UPI0018935799|nr:acetyl-CoA acetyltransferase [Nocardia blacklockiae]MBF6176418.1 acetyl-CoA acetyltransferase [Nocardia blacklockiae]
MRRAAIVSPVRTPSGLAGGVLAALPPRRLAAAALAGAVGRAGFDGGRVDEVVLAGPPGLARSAALDAGLPSALAGFDVGPGAGAGLSALLAAAMMVHSEVASVVVAGGVHDAAPLDAPVDPAELAHAEWLARRYHVTRAESDEYALLTRRRAARAWRQGFFDAETVPVVAAAPDELRHRTESAVPHLVDRDEQARADLSTRALISLAPLEPDGVLTAAAVSSAGAGAAACLVVAEDRLVDLGLEPLAYLTDWVAAGADGSAPAAVPAVAKVLARNGLALDDIDVLEVAERSAVEVLALTRHFGRHDLEAVNVNGGALALGDPGPAAGPRMTTSLLHELARRGGAYALVAANPAPDRGTAILFESATAAPTAATPKGARFHGLRSRRSGRHRA